MIDERAKVNQENCMGCGRYEDICPNEAISITINDLSRIDELIHSLESHVKVD